jgi:hypothetical protein
MLKQRRKKNSKLKTPEWIRIRREFIQGERVFGTDHGIRAGVRRTAGQARCVKKAVDLTVKFVERLYGSLDRIGKTVDDCYPWLGPKLKRGGKIIPVVSAPTGHGYLLARTELAEAAGLGLMPNTRITVRSYCDPLCCNPAHFIYNPERVKKSA